MIDGLAGTDRAIAIAVDAAGEKLYWSDGNHQIHRSDLSGNNRVLLLTLTSDAQALALDAAGGKIYWSNAQGIGRADLATGASIEPFVADTLAAGASLAVAYVPPPAPTATPTNTATPTATSCPLTGSIQGKVYSDLNGNGVHDSEPGLAGALIELRNSSNVLLDTRTTGADGLFQFDSLPLGQYTVTEIDPPGVTSTTTNEAVPDRRYLRGTAVC